MNPELLRQWWLEFSLSRAATLAVSLGALFALAALLDGRAHLAVLLPGSALVAFVALTVAWGGHRAGEALMDELRTRTWELQRLSALSPWRMLWGKWLGATSLAWAGGVLCLVVFALSARDFDAATRAYWILQAGGGALLVQGLSLLGALAIANHPRRLKGPLGSRLLAACVATGYTLLMFKLIQSPNLHWYGVAYPSLAFCTVVLWCAVGWVVIGTWRLMREDLQVSGAPWAWFAFLLFATTLAAGWYAHPEMPPMTQARLALAVALAVNLVAAYLAAFMLYRDPLMTRRLVRRWRTGELARLSAEMPLWIIALGLALLAALGCVLLRDGGATRSPLEDMGAAALVLWLFAARDLLLLMGVSFGARAERAELTALLYLGLLYWLLPGLLDFAGLKILSEILRPALWERPHFALGALGVQVTMVGAWVWFAYRARVRPVTSP